MFLGKAVKIIPGRLKILSRKLMDALNDIIVF